MVFAQVIFPIIVALIVFGILVIIHELGHFIVAKKNGILVKEFAVGMGPILFSTVKNETRYSLRLFPIGGFCSMLGEDGEDSPSEKSFQNKSVVQRMAVIVAGAFFNFIFAFITILVINSIYGFTLPVVTSFSEGYHLEESGIEIGDRIVEINGASMHIFEDVALYMDGNRGEPLEITVKRDGQKYTYTVTPQNLDNSGYKIGFNGLGKSGIVGKSFEGVPVAGFLETMSSSFWNMVFYVKSTIVGFGRIITRNISPDDIAGPVGIVQIIGDTYTEGMEYGIGVTLASLLRLAGLLSANLGAINLFPLPALDGGRFVFLFIEAIRKKPVKPEWEGMVHLAGFVALIGLMIVICFNDVSRIFG